MNPAKTHRNHCRCPISSVRYGLLTPSLLANINRRRNTPYRSKPPNTLDFLRRNPPDLRGFQNLRGLTPREQHPDKFDRILLLVEVLFDRTQSPTSIVYTRSLDDDPFGSL